MIEDVRASMCEEITRSGGPPVMQLSNTCISLTNGHESLYVFSGQITTGKKI